jgi:hypothetical protein
MLKIMRGPFTMRISGRLIFAAAVAAAAFAGTCVPSDAADLGPGVRRHVRTTWHSSNWRDRCAYAGYYCLYAWDGYVYHYPFDDRPSAYAYSARRHRHRY